MQTHCYCNMIKLRSGIIDDSSINLPGLPPFHSYSHNTKNQAYRFPLLLTPRSSSSRPRNMSTTKEKATAAVATLFNPLATKERELLTFWTTFWPNDVGDLSLALKRDFPNPEAIRYLDVDKQSKLIKNHSSIVALLLNNTVSSLCDGEISEVLSLIQTRLMCTASPPNTLRR